LIYRGGKGGKLVSEETDKVRLRVDRRKSCSRSRGRFRLGSFELEVNAKVEDHCLDLKLRGSAWDNVLRPDGVNGKSLKFNDVRKCRNTRRTTCGSKISNSSLNARPVGCERFVLSLSARKAICVSADVAATLELVLEVNRVPHVDTESEAVDVALEEKRPVGGLVGPFVEKVGKTSLTICITLGGTGISGCGGRSARGRGRRSRR
jgi:hypothetical protein